MNSGYHQRSSGHAMIAVILRLPFGIRLLIILAALALVSALDRQASSVSLLPLYLMVVAAGAFVTNFRAGAVLSLLAGVSLYFFDESREHAAVRRALLDSGFDTVSFLVMSIVMTVLRRTIGEARLLSQTGALIGMLDYRALGEVLEQELARARRTSRPISVAVIDLDNFKQVNDRFGHATGDELLQVMATVISASLRATDLAARRGGDEFVIVLPETPGAAAQAVIEKLRRRFMATMRLRGWPVSLSIGLLCCSTPPASVDEMLRQADELMCRSKQEGKDRVTFRER